MPDAHYDPSSPDGLGNGDDAPISQSGDPVLGECYLIPARQGRAVRIKAGETLTLHNPKGHQVCDFFALIEGSASEFLSMEHCRTALGRVYARQSDLLITNRRRPLVEIVEDTSPGVHDILIACCDHQRYQQLGCEGYHDNCADNFRTSLSAIGVKAKHVPSPFNIWMNIPVSTDGTYTWEAPVSRPGDFMRLRALEDAIFVMSACPQDMTPVNGVGTTPAELTFEINR